ncbi:pirin family protein [Nocardiopsis chromatogenes]|uniref:pirin family protein n=1 Tax=Nocardiopsis chromatogenes TaxID=280239 RepID=UPI0003471DB5|nr:pirin family protein [Nocardiopsis chromatogenes]
MSNVETRPSEQTVCAPGTAPGAPGPALPPAPPAAEPDIELLAPREVPLGGPRAMPVQRSLPNRERRMVGAWCFADFYGPSDVADGPGMQVPPHPHTGLQTVSWLLEGEVAHKDSLGGDRTVRPGELNLMTAGRGIAHSERSPEERPSILHGVQLWVAQPEADRDGPAAFAHHADLPDLQSAAGTVRLIAGEMAGETSPARFFSPLLGAEAVLVGDGPLRLPLEPEFEHAVLSLIGPVSAEGCDIPVGSVLYLGRGRRELVLNGHRGSRALLIGGTPFEEDLVMFWNFVGRSHEEIVAAREAWEEERAAQRADRPEEDGGGAPGPGGPGAGTPGSERFGAVPGDGGDPLPAPALPNAHLRPRSRYKRT